ncbi:type VII secretion protein EccB [Streptomyces litchfieldiae]|uniref:Type VII secretion protein EccB n=1 Tax=Streptomyces litchfieldiae TaxID=3075543 RepID=A0ABU2MI97_9ACTN|nr:type VII secretion protein EccB [Streptomyces sp. DSM 44938]MDT0341291.1 type VII secretion protein EccB [Streptomyces sp. DSM 44938]
MATTREQAEAYAYANRRMSTSLLRGADEARLDPRRRLNRSLSAGIAVGVLVMAGFGVAGWLGGGRGPALPANGAVVVGDSGDSYVVAEGVAHPALNLASALLAGGGQLTEVRQATLDEAARGLPVGIPGAPDALPEADDLLDGDWTLCATPAETGGDPVQTALYISVPGVPTGDAGGSGPTLLVETEDGGLWLLTGGRRHAVEPAVRDLLGLLRQPVRLPAGIIATVPEGPEITIPDPGSGTGEEPAAELPFEATVGDIAHTDDNGEARQYYLVRRDGLVPISGLVHTLLSGEAERDHLISFSDAAQAPRSSGDPGNPAWPQEVPEAQVLERNQPVCVSTPPGSQPGNAPWRATVHLPGTMPAPEDTVPVEAQDGGRLGLLDRIYLPAGSGTVVRAVTSAGTGGTHTLITDGGTAYPLSSPDAVERLGYDPARAPSMPTAYVDLLPVGPVLAPEAAAQEREGESE